MALINGFFVGEFPLFAELKYWNRIFAKWVTVNTRLKKVLPFIVFRYSKILRLGLRCNGRKTFTGKNKSKQG